MTFAARDFSPRRGASDEHIPPWICEERATKSGRKRPAALRVAPSSRLATGQIGRNERHRIYASDHLGFVQKHLPPRMRISNNTTLTLPSDGRGKGRICLLQLQERLDTPADRGRFSLLPIRLGEGRGEGEFVSKSEVVFAGVLRETMYKKCVEFPKPLSQSGRPLKAGFLS